MAMSLNASCNLPEVLRLELEKSGVPLAVYRHEDGKARTVLVSDGLVRWLAPGRTREDLVRILDEDMYRDVHHEDVVYVATKAKDFSKIEDGCYDVVYRQKLYGNNDYRTVHAVGYHRYLEDGTKCAVVVYDDVSAALESNGGSRSDFEEGVVEFLNTDKVDPFVIFNADTHEIYMVSASVEQVWKPVRTFDSGIKVEEYFFTPEERDRISVDDIIERGETIVRNPRTGKDLIVSVSQISWRGRNSVFLRICEHADRYFDPLTGLPNMEYGRLCGENYVEDIRNAGGSPVLIFFDIVGMKLYNSANGFNQGNEFLIDFASCIKKQFPDNLICRFSNDHFAVVADSSGIEDRLNIIRKSVKGTVSKISMDLYVGICNIEEYGVFLDASEKAKLACNIQKKRATTLSAITTRNCTKTSSCRTMW